MGNPFYIPRDNSRFQNVLGLAGLATQLYGLKQRGDIAGEEAELGRERNRLTGEDIGLRRAIKFGSQGIPGELETAATSAGAQATVAQATAAKVPEHQKNFGYGDKTLAAIAFKRLGLKDDNPVMQRISELAADKTITKGAAYQTLRSDEEMQLATIQALEEKMQSMAAKDENYLTSRDGQRDYQILQQISTPEGWGQAIDGAMSTTARSIKMEERNSKAALLEQQMAGLEERQKERLASQEEINKARLTSQKEINDAKLTSVGEVAALRAKTAEEIAAARLEAAKAIQESRNNKGPTPTEQRVTAKSIADAEEKIISNKSAEAAAGQADYFNQYAEKPYAYTWKPGKLYGGDWVKITLPKVKGVQVTARHVWEKAEQDGTTYDAVLKSIGAIK